MGNGIYVDSWAKVEGDCEIECEVVGDETQFRFGGRRTGLDLIFTEEGLENMAEKCTEALRQLRAQEPEADGDH